MGDNKMFSCYDPRFLAEAVVAAIVCIAAATLGKLFPVRTTGRVLLALVGAFATGWIIVRWVLVVRRLDEMHQRIQFEALAVAFAATGTLITASGFLEHAGMPRMDWGLWTWPLMVATWGVGLLMVRRRYL